MVNHPNRKRSLSERIAGLSAVKQERDALREESALYRMEADTLRTQNARLREALERIVAKFQTDQTYGQYAVDIARAALEATR